MARVLLAAHDPASGALRRHLLQVNGHEVVSADSFPASMDAIRSSSFRFVIVGDAMTQNEQRQLIKEARDRKIETVLLCGGTSPGLGADHYLSLDDPPLSLVGILSDNRAA